MTAIDLPAARSLPQTRLRLTLRGRRVLAALPAVIALAIAVLSGGGALASASSAAGGADEAFEVVTVMPGDSLWAIAERVAPSADPRDVVDDIVRLNALSGARLDPGQSIAIPAQYAG
ncbi:LysM peptidoglycan-binding domain-containing protein [Microbacterium sp.]|uniref:LysM peptidoglycan-binding domain-containing protein n=1 Tax=Microbacterium sp. TaxID=51671 RepID=UPI003A893AD9